MARRPSPGNLSDPFGWREHPITGEWKHHNGQDIGWSEGTTLVAPIDGYVQSYENNDGWGNLLVFIGDDGSEHRLAHTAYPLSGVGDRVKEGGSLAVMGDTGMAQGVHLHWEVLVDGKLVDPVVWLENTQNSGIVPQEDEDDMKRYVYLWWKDAGSHQNLIYSPDGNGVRDQWTSSDGAYNTRVATAYGIAVDAQEITKEHASVLIGNLDKALAK